ncbi:MAG: hypothetical protein JWM80_4058 [Cyanobacteria bacterium RYN_339]|nr:hypothetical protein [Cyanobacteria bacterium RYN_339]
MRADLDGSGSVDADDLRAFQQFFGKVVATCPEAAVADLNGDGVVDLKDFALLRLALKLPKRIQGDLNHDGKVNEHDLRIFQQFYGQLVAHCPEAKIADLNHDGIVNHLDLGILRKAITP